MKNKILLSIVAASSLLMGEAFAEHHGGMEDKVTFSGATAQLTIPEVHLIDSSGATLIMQSAHLQLIKAEEPFELEVTKLDSVDEDKEAHKGDDHDKVTFSVSTNKLIIPEVHMMNAEGMTTEKVSAELELQGFTPPYLFKVISLTPVVIKEAPTMDMPKKGDVDSKGCVYPETWHAPMNHCMDQTGSK
jgi:hypothetical protein